MRERERKKKKKEEEEEEQEQEQEEEEEEEEEENKKGQKERQRTRHQGERVRTWEVQEAVRKWAEFQAGQRILVTTPSIVVGYRAQVYRAEGATQWYTAVIVGHDEENGVCIHFLFSVFFCFIWKYLMWWISCHGLMGKGGEC